MIYTLGDLYIGRYLTCVRVGYQKDPLHIWGCEVFNLFISVEQGIYLNFLVL